MLLYAIRSEQMLDWPLRPAVSINRRAGIERGSLERDDVEESPRSTCARVTWRDSYPAILFGKLRWERLSRVNGREERK
jgi:hypothetical protein